MTTRRSLITTGLTFLAAPAIMRVTKPMLIKAWNAPMTGAEIERLTNAYSPYQEVDHAMNDLVTIHCESLIRTISCLPGAINIVPHGEELMFYPKPSRSTLCK